MRSVLWRCMGVPPTTDPCGAEGTTDRDAEKHVKATGHSVASGGAGAVGRAVERARAGCAAYGEVPC